MEAVLRSDPSSRNLRISLLSQLPAYLNSQTGRDGSLYYQAPRIDFWHKAFRYALESRCNMDTVPYGIKSQGSKLAYNGRRHFSAHRSGMHA